MRRPLADTCCARNDIVVRRAAPRTHRVAQQRRMSLFALRATLVAGICWPVGIFGFLAVVGAVGLSGCGSGSASDTLTSPDSMPAESATTESAATDSTTSGETASATSLGSATATGQSASTWATTGDSEQEFPDVIAATATPTGDTWEISATLSSPYDSPDRYADAWRIIDSDGTVYGVRILTHDHATEQPFTRSLAGVEIPTDVTEVTIQGRDLANGYGGQTFDLTLQR